MQAITAACPRLQLLMLGGCSIASTTAPLHEAMGQLQLKKKKKGLEPQSGRRPAGVSAVQAACAAAPDGELALVDRVQAFAVQLCITAAALQHLYAIEVSFLPPGIATALRSFLEVSITSTKLCSRCL